MPPRRNWAHPRDLGAIRMEAHLAKQRGDNFKDAQGAQMEGDELLDLRRWWLESIATTPAPSSGKDDPFLAWPFRHQRAEGQRRLLDVAAERYPSPACSRQFRNPDKSNVARSRHDDLSRSSRKAGGNTLTRIGRAS